MNIRFLSISLDDDARRRINEMRSYANSLPLEEFDGSNNEEMSMRIAANYLYETLPTIALDGMQRDEGKAIPNSRDVKIKVYLPYTADPTLYQLHHRTVPAYPGPPVYSVEDGFLTTTIQMHRDKLPSLASIMQQKVDFIEQYYDGVRKAVTAYNDQISATARNVVNGRHHEFVEKQRTQAALQALQIPIRKRPDGLGKVIIPQKRIKISVPERKAAAADPVREYTLGMNEYEDILRTVSSMVKVMERSPSAFASMGEESLRTIILVALNGLYEGQATGETFNGAGKTDILIRHDDRNVFIAECLMWKGEKYLLKKMNEQLFGYATWRDSKLALIVFNRGAKFTSTIDTMKATVKAHPQCIREHEWKHQSGGRYEFRRHDDSSRQFVLTALAFEVPAMN